MPGLGDFCAIAAGDCKILSSTRCAICGAIDLALTTRAYRRACLERHRRDFHRKPGATPQETSQPKKKAALKAQLTSCASWFRIQNHAPIESRLQRSLIGLIRTPGALPQAKMRLAPLALNRCSQRGKGCSMFASA